MKTTEESKLVVRKATSLNNRTNSVLKPRGKASTKQPTVVNDKKQPQMAVMEKSNNLDEGLVTKETTMNKRPAPSATQKTDKKTCENPEKGTQDGCRLQGSKGSKESKDGSKTPKKNGQKKQRKPREKMADGAICKSDSFNWKVIKILGSGGFGDVYKVCKDKDEMDKNEYAMKTEMVVGEKRMLRLKVEVAALMECMDGKNRKHFVDLLDRGKTEKFKFVVMSLVGSSLEDYRRSHNVDFSPSTALQASLQTLEAIRDLHQVGWLHRDIKPQNFAFGLGENENTVYVLDFGIAKRIHDKDKNVKKPRISVKFLGTLRFASRACHKLREQGRKDDMETWMYMMFDLFNRNKGLPWKKEADRAFVIVRKERFFDKNYFDVYFAENNATLKEMWPIVDHINKCEYATEPNYTMMAERMTSVAKEKNIDLTEKLDWIAEKKKLQASDKVKQPNGENTASEDNHQIGTGDSGALEDLKPDSKKKTNTRRKKSMDRPPNGTKIQEGGL